MEGSGRWGQRLWGYEMPYTGPAAPAGYFKMINGRLRLWCILYSGIRAGHGWFAGIRPKYRNATPHNRPVISSSGNRWSHANNMMCEFNQRSPQIRTRGRLLTIFIGLPTTRLVYGRSLVDRANLAAPELNRAHAARWSPYE